MSSGDRSVVYRPVLLNRLAGALGVLFVVTGVRSALDDLLWLLLAVAGVWMTGNWWRCVVLSSDSITVQGRFSRRQIALADVVQCGISTRNVPWVQARGAEAVEARMVSESYPSDQGPEVFVADVRARAEAAGAVLASELEGRADPEGPSTKVFSW